MAHAPLTDADIKRLDDALADVARAEEMIKRGEAGGIDMSELKARAREERARLTKLKSAFTIGAH